MITIKEDSWNIRWFLFCNKCLAQFTDGKGASVAGKRTNICVFFWVSFGAPILISFFHIIAIAVAGWALVGYPLYVLSWKGYLTEVIIIGAICLLLWVVDRLFHYYLVYKDKRTTKPKKIKKTIEPIEFKTIKLLWSYIMSVKDRTCLIMSWRDEE